MSSAGRALCARPEGGRVRALGLCLVALLALLGAACAPTRPQVVVYCALDREYAQPVLDEFQRDTGVQVLARYDLEASKTTGLVNQLLAEQHHPRCDVFWNNEMLQTAVLKGQGVLEPYRSPSAQDIPAAYRDPDGCWTGFAARLRVILVNTRALKGQPAPDSVRDLADPRWKGRCAMARPLFGTTLTHWAALDQALGSEPAEALLQAAVDNGVVVLEGNALVKDRVAAGSLAWGLTDSDDANLAVLEGAPVEVVLPDQDGIGTLLLPNTVALVRGGPHLAEGRRLLDYLLSREVEERLAAGRSLQIPLHPGVSLQPSTPRLDRVRLMQPDYERLAGDFPQVLNRLRERFLR